MSTGSSSHAAPKKLSQRSACFRLSTPGTEINVTFPDPVHTTIATTIKYLRQNDTRGAQAALRALDEDYCAQMRENRLSAVARAVRRGVGNQVLKPKRRTISAIEKLA